MAKAKETKAAQEAKAEEVKAAEEPKAAGEKKDAKGEAKKEGVLKGKVKWFDKRRGFGFITADNGTDYFVHYTDIQQEEGYKFLKDGQSVEFEVGTNEKGDKAAMVKVVA